ncbi:MAG: hypothetical protein DME86_07015 [Verrucomicrobia bacterium]|nr:MAG: hypothetical protein DME86_07015 [Verrucomicrobiota bacterium]
MKISISTLLTFIAAASLLPVWLHAEEVQKSSPPELASYYFVLLTRGPEWTAEKTPATEKIQAAHLANITKLHDAGKLVLAGPFTDNGNWRGIFIFKTSSIEETKSLVENDPAVQAERLTYEIHPWATKKGMLP